MKSSQHTDNKAFIGRSYEKKRLTDFLSLNHAAIMVVYGRRRVGKTELIEHTLHDHALCKFEGLENQSQDAQIQQVLYQLSTMVQEPYLAKLKLKNWVETLDILADKLQGQSSILYFGELQWLANYEPDFISALKFVWDNKFRHHANLKIILCGSSPSFMIKQVLHSKALYNRSQYEMHLEAFDLSETKEFLKNLSNQEVILAYLLVGGIPEYLNYLRNSASIFTGICKHSFEKNGFFNSEYERIFICSLADNPHYKSIIEYLSLRKFASRDEILHHLKIKSGGSLTAVLNDLELSGFIEKYQPFHLKSGRGLYRYTIADYYLMFYSKFIKPILSDIKTNKFKTNPIIAINQQSFQIWMGYAFERMIRDKKHLIAKILGFSGLPYKSGVYYNRKTQSQAPGYQIDLIYEHSKYVYTICEIKYYASEVGTVIISEFERKLQSFINAKQYTIQKVLITNIGITHELAERHYFDRVITVNDLFTVS